MVNSKTLWQPNTLGGALEFHIEVYQYQSLIPQANLVLGIKLQ